MAGYPDRAQQPISCDKTFAYVAQGLRFDCPGFTAGTSGGPLLTDPPSAHSRVVGVIGGYEEGGDSPSVSYSPVFGAAILNLYRRSVATGRTLGGRS